MGKVTAKAEGYYDVKYMHRGRVSFFCFIIYFIYFVIVLVNLAKHRRSSKIMTKNILIRYKTIYMKYVQYKKNKNKKQLHNSNKYINKKKLKNQCSSAL